MRYGYARISSDDQCLDRQRTTLARELCDQVIEETGSGVTARKRLDKLLARLVAGDELMVSEIDRLGRTTADVILMMDELTPPGCRAAGNRDALARHHERRRAVDCRHRGISRRS